LKYPSQEQDLSLPKRESGGGEPRQKGGGYAKRVGFGQIGKTAQTKGINIGRTGYFLGTRTRKRKMGISARGEKKSREIERVRGNGQTQKNANCKSSISFDQGGKKGTGGARKRMVLGRYLGRTIEVPFLC